MKNKIGLLLIVLNFGFMACNNSIKNKNEGSNTEEIIDTTKFNTKPVKELNQVKTTNRSNLRPDETILLNKMYTDTIEFASYNDDGDYNLLIGKKNEKEVVLIYNFEWQNIEKYHFKYGDLIQVDWKMDSIYIAGEGDVLDFKETAIEAKRIVSNSKPVKFLWRDATFDEDNNQIFNSIVINESFCKSITNQEKAALGYVATFIGNECFWDGKVNENRSNLKCKILTALNLGYQCSNTHLGFLKHWFSQDADALKKLEVCISMPETATVQTTFNEILIVSDNNHKTIEVCYKVQGVNMRESINWSYTQTDYFKYNLKNIWLINSEKSKLVHETLNNNPDALTQNSTANTTKSFTISCGSGCAMTYSEYEVTTKGNSNEVVFKVEMYINEVRTKEYVETYIITCDNSKKVSKIKLKGDDDYKIENQLPEVQKNLRSYASQLCKPI